MERAPSVRRGFTPADFLLFMTTAECNIAAIGDLSLIHILRAHETVLDLVCRLLLEKKNNKPIYTTYAHTTL